MSHELYADSAQARDQDRRMAERYDAYGRAIRPTHEFCYVYDEKAVREREQVERESQRLRVNAAISKMEVFFKCRKA